MPATEAKLEASKERIAASQEQNNRKIAALNEQGDRKVKEIQKKRNKEIAAVRAKTREQVEAIKQKNRELQKQWDALERQRAALHGKTVGDLFNRMIGDSIPTEAVEKLFAEKGDQLEDLLAQLVNGEDSDEPSAGEEGSEDSSGPDESEDSGSGISAGW